jgi:type I restriction enzyme S subunit
VFGRTVYVDSQLARYGFTQDLLRVIPKDGHEALCYAFLSSAVGFRLLRSAAVGTKLCSLRPDLVRALPVPEIDSKTLGQVREHIKAASKARSDSVLAEAEAVRIMEEEVIAPWRR